MSWASVLAQLLAICSPCACCGTQKLLETKEKPLHLSYAKCIELFCQRSFRQYLPTQGQ